MKNCAIIILFLFLIVTGCTSSIVDKDFGNKLTSVSLNDITANRKQLKNRLVIFDGFIVYYGNHYKIYQGIPVNVNSTEKTVIFSCFSESGPEPIWFKRSQVNSGARTSLRIDGDYVVGRKVRVSGRLRDRGDQIQRDGSIDPGNYITIRNNFYYGIGPLEEVKIVNIYKEICTGRPEIR